jgi:hypothetical protein
MKEVDLRRWHRRPGIIVALFIILQTGSGFLLSFPPPQKGRLDRFPHNGETIKCQSYP